MLHYELITRDTSMTAMTSQTGKYHPSLWMVALAKFYTCCPLGGVAGLTGLILPPLIALFALSTSLSAWSLNYICIWILHIGESNIWLSVKNEGCPAAVFDMQMCEISLRLNECHCACAIVLQSELMHRTSSDGCWLIACYKSSSCHWDIKGLTSLANKPCPPPLHVILSGVLQACHDPNEWDFFNKNAPVDSAKLLGDFIIRTTFWNKSAGLYPV